ncbi:hypothetical protein H6P81_014002 [Aristolochia fimbriata]|uniref:SAP30-binding protein n=1 Tax=Aristolochia fimbriata TaxID=158543 RepID=A0AAV7EGS2_ARIFI|nr:hypothetical protein H6P81_014002 [Aristolochia fimbriata]
MAGKSKGAEGIALLSMYNDEEDVDMEDEDLEPEIGNSGEVEDIKSRNNKSSNENTPSMIPSQTSQTPVPESDPSLKSPTPLTPPLQVIEASPQMPSNLSSEAFEVQTSRKSALGIVDYAHDETAMSPEPEEVDVMDTGRVVLKNELNVANGYSLEKTSPEMIQTSMASAQAASPQPSDPVDPHNNEASIPMDFSVTESEAADLDKPAAGPLEPSKEVDPLEKFLPPPPVIKCSEELQEKINKFLAYKRAGKSFNADLRNRKDYRNPDFLLHAVTYQEIDQIGTCFSKDVFDPYGYDPSDYYDKIEADMKREMEKKEQERKQSQKVEFVQGAVQPGTVISATKISTQVAAVAASGLLSAPTVPDTATREGRQNKKTKWDKVDGDRRIPLHPGTQDNIATTGAHAAILSAANAGTGYTAFAQQKRREAEERRSSERKLDKRS